MHSSKNNSFDGIKTIKGPVRMSCVLGEETPVLCSIIDDQPFFYFDEEELFEEDVIAADTLESFETFAESHDMTGKFDDHFSALTRTDPVDRLIEEKAPIFEKIEQSGYACEIMDTKGLETLAIEYSPQVETVFFDKKTSLIQINPNLNEHLQMFFAARELSRAFMYVRGTLIHPLLLDPEDAILINRVQNATLMTHAVRIMWELKLQDHHDLWKMVETSSMADLVHAHAAEANNDFRSLNNGQAARTVFERWFISDRCRAEDRTLIQNMLSDHMGYVFGEKETSEMVKRELISRIGETPLGKNFLTGLVDVVASEPLFSEVRDRANANFLWFVKFERRFQEKEQELQGAETELFNPTFRESSHDTIQEENRIITFPGESRSGKETHNRSDASGENGEVLPFPLMRRPHGTH